MANPSAKMVLLYRAFVQNGEVVYHSFWFVHVKWPGMADEYYRPMGRGAELIDDPCWESSEWQKSKKKALNALRIRLALEVNNHKAGHKYAEKCLDVAWET